MKEKKLIGSKDFKYSGIVDFTNFKKVIKDWGKRNNCMIEKNRTEERLHTDKKEMLMKVDLTSEVSDWLDITYKLSIDMRNMQEIEVEINGIKKEMWKVDANIKVKGIIEADSEEKWVGQPILLFFRQLTDKFIVRNENAKAEHACKKKMDSLLDEIRAYMNLEKLSNE